MLQNQVSRLHMLLLMPAQLVLPRLTLPPASSCAEALEVKQSLEDGIQLLGRERHAL